MRILFITQVIDRNDPTLGFFTEWVEKFDDVLDIHSVLCLKKGNDIPVGVPIYSLGKESIAQSEGTTVKRRLLYIVQYLNYLWTHRNEYDAVFVHMNEEYILVGGFLLRSLGKKIYLWRNHYLGSLRTRIAVTLSTKVFCTSRYSYTARFKKTTLMPVGVNFTQDPTHELVERQPQSILFLGRFDESKQPLLLVEALGVLKQKGHDFKALFVGAPSDPNSTYPNQVIARANELNISNDCEFVGAVKSTETWKYYRQCQVFVNCSRSGMFDKTMFEAAANGCLVVSSSLDLSELMGGKLSYRENDVADLAFVLMQALTLNNDEQNGYFEQLNKVLERNSLTALSKKLSEEMV